MNTEMERLNGCLSILKALRVTSPKGQNTQISLDSYIALVEVTINNYRERNEYRLQAEWLAEQMSFHKEILCSAGGASVTVQRSKEEWLEEARRKTAGLGGY